MYRCIDCGTEFEYPKKIREYLDDDTHFFAMYYGCPHCRSDDVEQVVVCDLCGEHVADGYVVLKDGTIACNDCFTLY